MKPTWSGLSPGGTQVYSSSAHPESSSEWAKVCGLCPLAVLAVVVAGLLVLLSMELLRVWAWFWDAWEAAAAAMAALVAAAKGSEWRLKELLWSSWGHLQFWQRGLERKEIWFYNRCLWVICNNLYNVAGLKDGKDEVVPVGDFEQSLFSSFSPPSSSLPLSWRSIISSFTSFLQLQNLVHYAGKLLFWAFWAARVV